MTSPARLSVSLLAASALVFAYPSDAFAAWDSVWNGGTNSLSYVTFIEAYQEGGYNLFFSYTEGSLSGVTSGGCGSAGWVYAQAGLTVNGKVVSADALRNWIAMATAARLRGGVKFRVWAEQCTPPGSVAQCCLGSLQFAAQ